MNLLFLLIGIVLGLAVGWLLATVLKKQKGDDPAQAELLQVKGALETAHTKLMVEEEKGKVTVQQVEELKVALEKERQQALGLSNDLASRNAMLANYREKLDNQAKDIESLNEKLTEQFKNLANKILDEKSEKFTAQNKENIHTILAPLNEKLKDFEKKVEDTYVKGVKDRTDLQAEIKKLHDLNAKISEDATNLTKALKGDVKKQGNWGEVVLERILESSGLEKDREYKIQVSFNREDGGRYQPDVVVYLPDNKNVVIDSKVSLVAYESYVNALEQEDQQRFMKEHVRSIKAHIKELADKQYFNLEGLNTPEYVLMFLPIEASFGLAVKEDAELFNYAWSNKIVVVSPSTLTATLMTISSIWRQENQTRNAIEIAKKGGGLYDKFEGLVRDLLDLGNKLKGTQKAYESSMNKLVEGKGNLVNRVEELKKLGANASKALPDKLIERAGEQEAIE